MRLVLTLSFFCIAPAAYAQRILHSEPPPGSIRNGEIVLLDNGKCPRGQLEKITGNSLDADASRADKQDYQKNSKKLDVAKQMKKRECVQLYPSRKQPKQSQQ